MLYQKQEKKEEKMNVTGIPDSMRKKAELKSGLSFEDVRVHYNSAKPAQVGALAYTMGSQVYLGQGQEKHLPHELGHIVQQKQGRVMATKTEGGLPVNDDLALEKEADEFL